LINLFETSKYEDVREIAEQILLSYSFKNNKKGNKINSKHFKGIDDMDDNTLSNIVKSDEYIIYVRNMAVNRISDEIILGNIAIGEYSENICKKAVRRIISDKVLCDIVKCAKYSEIRKDCVKRISNKNVLKEVMEFEEEKEVRLLAERQLNYFDSDVRIGTTKSSQIRKILRY